jgi:hypothetical protein
MPRFILRYRPAGPRPDADARRIAALPGVELVDDSPRMLLVDGPEAALRAALADLPAWVMTAETSVPLPDVRRRPRRRS